MGADHTGAGSYPFSIGMCVSISKHAVGLLGIFRELLIHNIGMQDRTSWYREREVEKLAAGWRFVMRHLTNLDHVIADVERVGATLYGEKSNQRRNRVNIIRFDIREIGRWLQVSKGKHSMGLATVLKPDGAEGILTGMHLLSYMHTWVINSCSSKYGILLKDIEFQWGTQENNPIVFLQQVLSTVCTLSLLVTSNGI